MSTSLYTLESSGSQSGVILSPEDIRPCLQTFLPVIIGVRTPTISGVEARDVTKHRTMYRKVSLTKNFLAQNIHGAQVEKPSVQIVSPSGERADMPTAHY